MSEYHSTIFDYRHFTHNAKGPTFAPYDLNI